MTKLPLKREEYSKYVTDWSIKIKNRLGDDADDPDVYIDMATNEKVRISNLVKLKKSEVAALDNLADSVKNCDEECVKIKEKLTKAGWGIFVTAKLVSRPPDGVGSLRKAIFAGVTAESREAQSLDRFDPEARKTKVVAIKPKPSELALTSEQQRGKDVSDAFDKHGEQIVEDMKEASEGDEVCIDLITAVKTCPGAKGIKELDQEDVFPDEDDRVPNVRFTYLESKGYPIRELRVLLKRYVAKYKDEGGKTFGYLKKGKGPKKSKKEKEEKKKAEKTEKKKSPPSKRQTRAEESSGEEEEELSKKMESLKVSKKTQLVQPKTTTAQRTVGGVSVPVRTVAPKLVTPAIAAAAKRTPVKAVSTHITELSALVKKKQLERKGGETASKALSKSIKSSQVAPEGVQPKVTTKTSKTVTMPIALKSREAAKRKVEKEVSEEAEEAEEGEEEAEEGEEVEAKEEAEEEEKSGEEEEAEKSGEEEEAAEEKSEAEAEKSGEEEEAEASASSSEED